MTCDETINRYIALDKHEMVPAAVTLHILRCKKCRSLIRAMTKASNLYSAKASLGFDSKLLEKTMLKINEAIAAMKADGKADTGLPEVRLFPWIIAGTVMIIGFASIPFTSIGRWAAKIFGLAFTVPFALIFAVFVSVFSALFVGSNLDFFIKKFDLNQEQESLFI